MTKGLPRWWPSYFKSRKIWTTFGARLLASQIVSLLIYLSLMHVSPKLFSDPVPVLGQQDYLNEIISHWQLPRLVVVSMYHPYLFGGRVETVLQDGSLPSYGSAGGESCPGPAYDGSPAGWRRSQTSRQTDPATGASSRPNADVNRQGQATET